MNFIDVYIDHKIKKWYLKIITIEEANNNRKSNKHIRLAIISDKIRIFKVVVDIKKKHGMDFSDDLLRIQTLNNEELKTPKYKTYYEV